jgi:hypothetical protein
MHVLPTEAHNVRASLPRVEEECVGQSRLGSMSRVGLFLTPTAAFSLAQLDWPRSAFSRMFAASGNPFLRSRNTRTCCCVNLATGHSANCSDELGLIGSRSMPLRRRARCVLGASW